MDRGQRLSLEERLRWHVRAGERDGLEALVRQAVAERPAGAVLSDVLLPSMDQVRVDFDAGRLILPSVLRSAEVIHRALGCLGNRFGETRGSIVVATLQGDVHDIGRCLLVSLLEATGFTVHDLGRQVPIDAIVDAAVQTRADAIGLSALLVTTSQQMPRCIQELDRRGVHIPVLLGGAAINRAFGRRAAILPDGRVYAPGVFYCRDVFEGLAVMDALVDPARRDALVAQVRSEISAERDRGAFEPPPTARTLPRATPGSRPPPAPVPEPPYWGARRVTADLGQVWPSLDRHVLFRYHWGGHRAKGPEFERLVPEVFEPWLAALTESAVRDGWLDARIVAGYFPCNAVGDELLIFDPRGGDVELARLVFPRQPDGEQLCLADYFRPLASGQRDAVALQAVSVGPRAAEEVQALQRAGEFERMLLVNGLASATAEALANFANGVCRRELGLSAERGLRFSWGYPACPDLGEQRKVLPLLRAEQEIGLRLTASHNLDPEHSTTALIVHHPAAKYFSVRPAGP